MIGVLDIYGFEIFRVCLQTASGNFAQAFMSHRWKLEFRNASQPLHLKWQTSRQEIKVFQSLPRNVNKVTVCGF